MQHQNPKRVTLKDIAEKLGISSQAVSMAVRNSPRLSAELRSRILQTVQEMNYVPNVAARSLTSRKSFLIGAILPYVSQSFFGNILAGIEQVAQANDFSILIGNNEGGVKIEKRALELMQLHKVDGIIAIPSEEAADYYRRLHASGIPIVQIMHSIPGCGDYSVTIDNYGGAQRAAEFFLGHGHRHIGFISHGDSLQSTRARACGFGNAIQAAGVAMYVEEVEISVTHAFYATKALLQRHPQITALFCASDYAALGALRALHKLKIKVPDQLELIGFDDLKLASEQAYQNISTVAQPKEKIGSLAAKIITDFLQSKRPASRVLAPRLILRDTTR